MAQKDGNPASGGGGAPGSDVLAAKQNTPEVTPNSKPAKSWRDVLPIHPAAELFPLLSETDPAALKELGEDIRKNGLASPIVLWADDDPEKAVLLDGRNRLDAMGAVAV